MEKLMGEEITPGSSRSILAMEHHNGPLEVMLRLHLPRSPTYVAAAKTSRSRVMSGISPKKVIHLSPGKRLADVLEVRKGVIIQLCVIPIAMGAIVQAEFPA